MSVDRRDVAPSPPGGRRRAGARLPAGGTVGLLSWTPEGMIGALFRTMGPFAPAPPPGGRSRRRCGAAPITWGELFGDRVRFSYAGPLDLLEVTAFPAPARLRRALQGAVRPDDRRTARTPPATDARRSSTGPSSAFCDEWDVGTPEERALRARVPARGGHARLKGPPRPSAETDPSPTTAHGGVRRASRADPRDGGPGRPALGGGRGRLSPATARCSSGSAPPRSTRSIGSSGAARAEERLPAMLGSDVSGTVEDSRTEGIAEGDEVFGFARAAATRSSQPPPHGSDREKARGVSHEQAAAMPVAGLTAWQALHDRGKLERRQTALIAGAAGDVGHFAVQFAKLAGARVDRHRIVAQPRLRARPRRRSVRRLHTAGCRRGGERSRRRVRHGRR